MYVTVTAATRCALQPGMSPELDGGNAQWRAMDRIGEEQQNTRQMQTASKKKKKKKKAATHIMKQGSNDEASETLSHRHHRPSQTPSDTHLPLRHNTLITPQLLPSHP